MKRNITLFLLQILFIVKATAQPEIRGIALCDLSSFRKGDTISIKGYIYDKTKGIEKYLVKSDNVERYVSASYIQLLDNDNESNLLALEYIEAAQQIDHYHLAEVLLVKGIILMRLERFDEAREVLNEFISASENFYFRVLP